MAMKTYGGGPVAITQPRDNRQPVRYHLGSSADRLTS